MRAWLALALGLPGAAVALGEKPVLVAPYEDGPCWVSVFDGAGYGPPSARLDGPNYYESARTEAVVEPDLRNVGGQDFVDRIESLVVGPRGRVTLFEEPRFNGRSVSFGPGAQVPDLAQYGLANRVRSMRVRCE